MARLAELVETIKIKKWLGVLLLLAVLLMPYIADSYWLHVLIIVAVYIILAIGLNMLTGVTGLLSIGHAAFFGIGAYTSALLAIKLNLSFWITLPLATILAGILGLLLSLPCLRLKGPYLTITTIGFGQIIYTFFVEWRELTKGPMGLTGIPSPKIGSFSIASSQAYYYLILVFVFLAIFVAMRIENSIYGRSMKAIRDDELSAEISGVNVIYYKMYAFALSAVYAGLAGGLYAHYLCFLSPDSFTFDFSTMMLMMILIGGLGSVQGAIIGAFIVALLPEMLREFKMYQMIIYGLLLILGMIYMPKGIVQLYHNVVGALGRKDSDGQISRATKQ
ncbi:MAG: branched-chain amino acid ABC transporter permease [Peptococcaceae bacterium]|jgi:branched-chain amino acid transport system permease protein|nr:branched-chain amino acid ABC transporter permease [Peptococcaceae bacterium]MDH7524828.1 branched-chain amino acid ABC transporter permease [Peptococcaceae bacterium]